MAGRTTGGDAGMVHRGATFEAGGGFVAGFTGRSGGDVAAGFGFDVGKAAAVTGRTPRRNTRMVHWGWYKVCGAAMAAFAIGRGREMRLRFSHRGDACKARAVMAA